MLLQNRSLLALTVLASMSLRQLYAALVVICNSKSTAEVSSVLVNFRTGEEAGAGCTQETWVCTLTAWRSRFRWRELEESCCTATVTTVTLPAAQ